MKKHTAFIVITSTGDPILPTCRYTRKDAVSAVEEWAGASWASLKTEGYRCRQVRMELTT